MNPGEPILPAPNAQADAPVHCAECGKYNERDAVTCGACGSHLWVKCSRCGVKNLRTTSRCARCRKRLRAETFAWPRLYRRFRNRKQKQLVRGLFLLLLLSAAVWLAVHSVPDAPAPPPNGAVSF